VSGARAPRLAAALAGAVLLAASSSPAAEEILARVFEVRYRPLADAAELVGELLSPEGTVLMKPRLKTLIVEDRPAVLDRVQALLASYDLPPRSVEITFSLFLGSREEGAPGGRDALSQEVRGVLETLGDFTRWTAYEPLGGRSVTGVEGDPVQASLSGDYRVAFKIESVHQSHDVVKFDHITLERVQRAADGPESVEQLFSAGGVVRAGKLTLFGAAAAPDSKRALFLALQVTPR
jgi:hypothetical protein